MSKQAKESPKTTTQKILTNTKEEQDKEAYMPHYAGRE
jgi:hypothetical protein